LSVHFWVKQRYNSQGSFREILVASSLNKVLLIGNVGRDPEIRVTGDGTKVATFSVATSESWLEKGSNERKERVEWHNVVIFNPHLADVTEQYIKKGQKVYVEGSLRTRKYTDAKGQEQKAIEILIRYRGDVVILNSNRKEDRLDGDMERMDQMDHDEIPF
jgi:single-strand DNA-binding protein